MIYFVYGPAEKEIRIKKIISDIIRENPGISEKYFDGAAGEESDFLNCLSANSMFGGKQLIVLKRAETIKKGIDIFKKIEIYNLTNKDVIIDYLFEEKTMSKKILTLFEKLGKVIEIEKTKNGTDIIELIKNELKCSQKDAQKIYEMKGYNINAIYTEIDKLQAYFDNEQFDMNEAKNIISATPEYNLFQYLEDLFMKKKGIEKNLFEYLKINNEYIPFLYAVSSTLRLYTKLKMFCIEKNIRYISNYNVYIKNTYPVIKEYFSEHPYAIFKKLENIDYLDIFLLKKKLREITEMEFKIKSGALSDRDAVERFILNFRCE